MQTTATGTVWEREARQRKVVRLVLAIDSALIPMGVDPFSRDAHLYVSSMSEKAWQIACDHARCQPASETTRAALVALYAERTARAA